MLAPNPLPPISLFFVVGAGAILLAFGAIRSIRADVLRTQDIALAVAGGVVAVVGVVAF